MSWNYRVIRHKSKTIQWLQIHEVFYKGDCVLKGPHDCPNKVVGMTREGATVTGTDAAAIKYVLEKMQEALTKPILEYEKPK